MDMFDMDFDFPPRAHCLSRWWVWRYCKYSRKITTQCQFSYCEWSIYSCMHSVIHPYIFFISIYLLIPFNHPFILCFLRQTINLLTHSFIHPFIDPSNHSFIHSFIHSLIHPSIHACIHSFIHSFIHLSNFVHSCFGFLPRYGLKEFLVIIPSQNVEAIDNESRCSLLLSSIAVAFNNSKWLVFNLKQGLYHVPPRRICPTQEWFCCNIEPDKFTPNTPDILFCRLVWYEFVIFLTRTITGISTLALILVQSTLTLKRTPSRPKPLSALERCPP